MSPVEAARRYRKDGHYDLALACLRELPASGEVGAEMARALTRLGRAAEATRIAQAAVAQEDEALPEALLALAEAALAAGHTDEARAAVERARELTEALHGPVSLPTARALDARAAVLAASGDGPGALAPATRAIAILDQLDAPADERALARHTLAEAQHRAGRYAEARATWGEVLKLRRASQAPDHPEISAALFGLALTLGRLGRPAEAIARHREALSIAEARLGRWHPAIAAGHHGLGQALHRSGDFPGARDALRLALAVSERVQGAEHPDTWVTRFELGRMEVDCGDFSGFARMESARARLRDALGADHPTVLAMNRWL